LNGPYHQQSRRPQAIDEMIGANSSKEHIGVPGQAPRIDNRLTQNARNLLIGKLLVGRSEQHERDLSGKRQGRTRGERWNPFCVLPITVSMLGVALLNDQEGRGAEQHALRSASIRA
jgi:hypothetical protein